MFVRRWLALGLIGVLANCGSPAPEHGPEPSPTADAVHAEVVATGLEHGWDIGFLPGNAALISQRPGRLTLLEDGKQREVRADLGDVFAEGEGGLMGLVVHPDFASNRRFVTCQTHQEDERAVDVRLITWRLSEDRTSARRVGPPLLSGLPVHPGGRHSGCRPALAEDGALLVSTGDTAQPAVPQDRTILGGKVLRVDLNTGRALPGNPFLRSADPDERRVFTYGHRNPQGVAPRPGGQILISEHGPTAHDEINVLRPGGNYGWAPSRGGTSREYDESVPMTDLRRFPHAVPPAWSSGNVTEAVSGATFLTGPQWGRFDGMLAVTALRGQKLLLFRLNPDGSLREVETPSRLDGTHGRLRAARQGPDGALYVTTSNGSDDKVLRITAS